MIKIEKLKQVKTVVVHAHCPDGMASAILLKDALPHARVVFLQHGTKEAEEFHAVPGLLYCDFCPPEKRAMEFVDAGTVVLDHHKTSKNTVMMFGDNGVYADNEVDTEDKAVSGAMLAYRHVWNPIAGTTNWSTARYTRDRAMNFALLAGIRDTWQSKSDLWKDACAQAEALMFYPVDFWMNQMLPAHGAEIKCHEGIYGDEIKYRDGIFSSGPDGSRQNALANCLKIGNILLAKKDESVAEAIRSAHRFTTIKGLRVIAFNSTSLTSDAAEKLGKEADVVAGFAYKMDDGKAVISISTRSHTGFDCAELAKRFGGGGHKAAAGFSIKFRFLGTESGMPWWTDSDSINVSATLNPYAFLEILFSDDSSVVL